MNHVFSLLARVSVLQFIFSVIVACSGSERNTSTSSQQVKAVDARGVEVVLDHYAERLVVLFEPFVDEIYMLGAGDKLVGIPQQIYQNASTFQFLSQLDQRIAKKEIATPTFGGRSTQVETVVSLQADLAIVYQHDIETIAQLEEFGIPVFVVSSKGKNEIFEELLGVGTLIGKKERAEAIIDYVNESIHDMKVEPDAKRKSVYYAWSKGRVFSTSGRGSLVDLSIETAGAVNACPLELEAPNVSAESIYKWDPDLIVLWNSNINDVYSLAELSALPAVVNKQVYAMEPSFYFDPHTVKFVLFAKQLSHWCYPDKASEGFDKESAEILSFLYQNKLSL